MKRYHWWCTCLRIKQTMMHKGFINQNKCLNVVIIHFHYWFKLQAINYYLFWQTKYLYRHIFVINLINVRNIGNFKRRCKWTVSCWTIYFLQWRYVCCVKGYNAINWKSRFQKQVKWVNFDVNLVIRIDEISLGLWFDLRYMQKVIYKLIKFIHRCWGLVY